MTTATTCRAGSVVGNENVARMAVAGAGTHPVDVRVHVDADPAGLRGWSRGKSHRVGAGWPRRRYAEVRLASRTEVRAYRSGMTASASEATAPDPDVAWVPVDACTLPTVDRPLRVAEFDDLFATALRDVRHQATGTPWARLMLAGDETLADRVRRLAEAESSCCSFFTFTVTELGPETSAAVGQARIAVDIAVPSAGADVLEALVDRATGLATA
jgi:hypothetical protein